MSSNTALITREQDSFFPDLTALMQTTEFRHFYKTHMATRLDLRSSLVYIELWNNIDRIYEQCTGKNITNEDMEVVLRETFRRKEYRRPLLTLIQSYLDDDVSRGTLDEGIQTFFRQQMKALEPEGLLYIEDGKDKKI
jgi:hypothetical protein